MPPQHLELILLCLRMITWIYATEKHEPCVHFKLQRGLTAVNSWCERWNITLNGGKTQASYFTRRPRVPDNMLQLNGRDIPFVNNVRYLGVISDRRMTWRHHIKRTVAKALRTYVRAQSLLKNVRLSTNIKLMLYKALIRSVMTFACPILEYVVNVHLLKLQCLQNIVLRVTVILTGTHQSTNCIWLSKFLTCMTIQLNYTGHRQK
jgi:hypothetical protein